MSTSTLRLQLTKPAGSDDMKLGAAQISDAYTKIDAAMGVKKFATSGAATNIFDGDLIAETSTNKSKLFKNPDWVDLYDSDYSQGNAQELSAGPASYTLPFDNIEHTVVTQQANVIAGRKYLVNFNFPLTAINTGGVDDANRGYMRFNWYWDSDLNAPATTFIHDCASYISAVHSSRSKNLTGLFEFFPNYTGTINIRLTVEVLTGNENLELNLGGSDPGFYLQDWGV